MSVTHLEIIVGTYEEFLLGYKVSKNDEQKFHLVQSFADHSHRASIRCVAAEKKYMASGSADESITLYDMKSRSESGILTQHTGTVSCVSFSPDGSHLISASEDGSIVFFRVGNWQVEKVFPKAHGGEGVTHLSVHPSGKLALTVGNDATLRTWNLIKGRQAYATSLGKSRTRNGRTVTCLMWSPSGNNYILAIGPELNVYDVSTANVVYSTKHEKKIAVVCFVKDTVLAVGDEGGGILLYDISEKLQLNVIEAHKSRVKCLKCVSVGEKKYLVSASSSGEIKLWKYKARKFKELCSTNCDCRITCLVVFSDVESKQENDNFIKEEEDIKSVCKNEVNEKKRNIRSNSYSFEEGTSTKPPLKNSELFSPKKGSSKSLIKHKKFKGNNFSEDFPSIQLNEDSEKKSNTVSVLKKRTKGKEQNWMVEDM